MALIGDSERERAVAQLRGHYARGRLSLEELAERLELALGARRDGEVRVALAELPSHWFEHPTGAPAWLTAQLQAAGRLAFVVAVWFLWWATSIVLLIGFVVSLVVTGLTLVNVLVFGAVWLACTLLASRLVRRRRQIGR